MTISKVRKKELLRFLIGGGSAVLVDFIMYKVFMEVGLDRNAAKLFSFFCGSLEGFLINKLWTFESRRFSSGEVVRYTFLYSCTAVLNGAVNKSVLSICPLELMGFLWATGISTVLNFLGQKYFVFRT